MSNRPDSNRRAQVRRLNTMPKEPTIYDLGINSPHNVHGRYKLKGSPKATLRGGIESKAADWWGSSLTHVNQVRAKKPPKLIGRKEYRTTRELIDAAAPAKRRLYRGIKADPTTYKRGTTLVMPESSWTEDKRLTAVYANRDFKGKPVVLHLKEGPRAAVHIAPLTRYRNAEWVTPKSKYKVRTVATRNGVKHVYLTQGPVQKGLWLR